MNILNLPEEIIREIALLLDIHDIHNLYLTNSILPSILDDNHFWKTKIGTNKYIDKYTNI